MGGEWKDRCEYSKRQLTKFDAACRGRKATAQQSGISCRTHSEPIKEMRCEGPCGLYKILDQFSRNARSGGKTWCRECTEWQTKNEPGFIPWMAPNEALHFRDRQTIANRPLNSVTKLHDDMAWVSPGPLPMGSHSAVPGPPSPDGRLSSTDASVCGIDLSRARYGVDVRDRLGVEGSGSGGGHRKAGGAEQDDTSSRHASSAFTEASDDTTRAGDGGFFKYKAYGPDGQQETRQAAAATVYSDATTSQATHVTKTTTTGRSGWEKPVRRHPRRREIVR